MFDTLFMYLVPAAIVAVFVGIAVRAAKRKEILSKSQKVRWVVPVDKPKVDPNDPEDLMEGEVPREDQST